MDKSTSTIRRSDEARAGSPDKQYCAGVRSTRGQGRVLGSLNWAVNCSSTALFAHTFSKHCPTFLLPQGLL